MTNRLASALEAAFQAGSTPDTATKANGHDPAVAKLPNGMPAERRPEEPAWPERAVARVNSVAAGSPAEQAVGRMAVSYPVSD